MRICDIFWKKSVEKLETYLKKWETERGGAEIEKERNGSYVRESLVAGNNSLQLF